MAWQIKSRVAIYGLVSLCLLILVSSPWWRPLVQRPPLLLAPMMDLTPCLLAQPGGAASSRPEWVIPCTGPKTSSAQLVESTLRRLQTAAADRAAGQLGYTLQVPLLALLQPGQNGWHVNRQAIDNIVRTVRDNPRPLVLYLFSFDPDNRQHASDQLYASMKALLAE